MVIGFYHYESSLNEVREREGRGGRERGREKKRKEGERDVQNHSTTAMLELIQIQHKPQFRGRGFRSGSDLYRPSTVQINNDDVVDEDDVDNPIWGRRKK